MGNPSRLFLCRKLNSRLRVMMRGAQRIVALFLCPDANSLLAAINEIRRTTTMASKETTEVIDLPINEKFGLSIKEASAFFGIGIKKMRRLAETHRNEFAFYNGNRYIFIESLTLIPVW